MNKLGSASILVAAMAAVGCGDGNGADDLDLNGRDLVGQADDGGDDQGGADGEVVIDVPIGDPVVHLPDGGQRPVDVIDHGDDANGGDAGDGGYDEVDQEPFDVCYTCPDDPNLDMWADFATVNGPDTITGHVWLMPMADGKGDRPIFWARIEGLEPNQQVTVELRGFRGEPARDAVCPGKAFDLNYDHVVDIQEASGAFGGVIDSWHVTADNVGLISMDVMYDLVMSCPIGTRVAVIRAMDGTVLSCGEFRVATPRDTAMHTG